MAGDYPVTVNKTIITDRRMLYEFVDLLMKQEYLATDIESSTLSPFSRILQPEVGVVGFAWTKKDAVAFPAHARIGLKCKISVGDVMEGVKEVWENAAIKFLTWHGKFDMGYMLARHGIWLGGRGHKTGMYSCGMLASYALDERKGIHGLKDWAPRVGMADYDAPLLRYTKHHPQADPRRGGNLLLVPAPRLYNYNMDDCICTYRTFFIQRKELKEKGLWKKPFQFPLMYINWVATMMEVEGLKIDKERNEELNVLYTKRIIKIDKELYSYPEIKQLQEEKDIELLGKLYRRVRAYKRPVPNVKAKVLSMFKPEPVNLNSPDIRRKLVFDVLGYDAIELTDGGLPSAARWILEELQAKEKNPILGQMIERTELASAFSKYIKPVKYWINTDGRTHTYYKPHGTATGRVSSENPNHEALPKRNKLAQELLTQFVSRGKGYFILSEDSKQIEMRLFADRAQDDEMIAEFNAGKDPHAMGAQAAFNLTEEQWARLPEKKRKQKRTDCKSAVSFGLLYGRLAEALAKDFGWSKRKAEKFIRRYFGKYDDCAQYIVDQKEYILENGVVISHFNRYRHLPDVESPVEGLRNAAIREGINSPIQGDASDLTWIAGYRLARWLFRNKMKSRVIVIVHDAVYVDTYHKEMEVVAPQLHKYMTDRKYIKKKTGWYCSVALDTDASVGLNLGVVEELEHTKIPGQFIIPEKFC